MPYSIEVFQTHINPGTTHLGTEEQFSSVILYYQCKSGHDFICMDSQSSSIIQESDSGRFSFTNQEVITLTL